MTPALHPHPAPPRRPIFSVRSKLVALMAVLLAAISLFMYLFFPARLEKQAIEAIATKAAAIAEMSAYTLGPALDFGQVDEVEEALAAALQFEDVRFAHVQGTDGTLMGSFTRDAAADAHLTLTRHDGLAPDGGVYHVRRPIVRNGQELGQLYMGFSLTLLRTTLHRSRIALALASLLVFLLGIGATFGISVFITRPLDAIMRVTGRIAQGDLASRADAGTNDEIGLLAASFNDMVDNLASAYDALRTSEERFRAVIENTTDVIVLLSPDGTLEYLSPSVTDVLGYTPQALVGRNGFDFVHDEDQPLLRRGLRISEHQPRYALKAEARWRHRDGSWRYLSYRGKNMMAHPGIESILISARDVTESKQAEQELVVAKETAEEMVRLKDAFLANMSHEIRTPLTGILGATQVLAEEVEDGQREWVDLVASSGRRLLDTLNSVLDLAQLEARAMELVLHPLDVCEEVREVSRMLKPLAADGVALTAVLPNHAVYAALDRNGIHRILTNLTGNALKFTKEGRVQLAVEADDETVYIHVRDTGIGISSDFLPHLFDEFKQESTGASRSHEGSGLGLAITQHLTEMMHGDISVQSVKGVGSVFTVSFPLLAPVETPVALPVEARPPGPVDAPAEAGLRVLLVEDQPDTRHIAKRFLRDHCTLDAAATGEEGLELAASHRYDLIFMDINLGAGMDGVATLQALRGLPAYAEVPVIAMTAYAMPEDETRFLNFGFDAYLSKPFTLEQLTALVHTVPAEAAPSRLGPAVP